jgi:phosphomannomutase
MSASIPSLIFRAYDIRGIFEETLTLEAANNIGKAFATYVKRNTGGCRICVGFDGRLSSPALEEQLVKGMVSAGAEVVRVGMGPTPLLYFSVKYLQADAGIMVTGSHNPPTHNGFKMLLQSRPLFGEHIQELYQMIEAGDLDQGSGSVAFEEVLDPYVEKLKAAVESDISHLRIAWDPGNGAAGEVASLLADEIPGEHIVINGNIDGQFPSHHPDPTVEENMEQLKKVVLEEKCDLGIAFDGDGDRIGAIDNQGRMIWGDQLLALYAKDVLRQNPGSTVIADVKASQTLFEEIKKSGGNPLMWRTGHSFIKVKMLEEKAPLAGEMSGHIFFADHYGFDDGIFAAMKLVNILGYQKRSIAELTAEIPSMISTPELRIDVDDSIKFDVMERIKGRLKSSTRNVNDIDGVRVSHENGWWLLRASNTQAALVARCESSSDEGLSELKKELQSLLAEEGIPVNF